MQLSVTKSTRNMKDITNRLGKIQKQSLIKALFVCIFLVHSFLTIRSVAPDGGAFITIASGILEGRLPYVAYFDHKPPGIYFTVAAIFAVIQSVLAVKVLVLFANISTAYVIFHIGNSFYSHEVGLYSSLLYLISSPLYSGHLILTEPFLALFGTLGLFYFCRSRSTNMFRDIFVAGIAIGISAQYKQTGLLYLGAIGLSMIWFCYRDRKLTRFITESVVLALGAALPFVLVTGVFYIEGGLSEYLELVYLIHLPGGSYAGDSLRRVVEGNFTNVMIFPLLWSLLLTGLFVIYRDRSPQHIVTILMVVVMVPSFAVRSYPHYYIQILPFVSLIAGISVEKFRCHCNYILEQPIIRVLFLSFILILSLPVGFHLATQSAITMKSQITFDQSIGDKIRQISSADDKMIVLTSDAKYYYFADREPPNKFIYYLPVNRDRFSTENLITKIQSKNIDLALIHSCRDYVQEVCTTIRSEYILAFERNGISVYSSDVNQTSGTASLSS